MQVICEKLDETKSLEGPCVASIDDTLREIGVQRQAYHSNSFVGNDCHNLLKDDNIEKLCFSLVVIVSNLQAIDNDFIADVSQSCTKFQMLFQK